MATELGKLAYTLVLNDEGFQGKLASDVAKTHEAGSQMSGSMQETEKSAGGLKSAISSMAGQFVTGQAIFAAGQFALSKVNEVIHSGIEAAKDWQTQQAGLNAELTSTKDASGLSAEAIKKLAEQTEGKTAIDKSAVLTGQNMLLTFTNIGKNAFPQATQAMVDMATRMNGGMIPSGQMLSNTAIQLGKALNDPTTGMMALHRVGVAFTDQQKEQITTLQKNGDTMGAQKIILAELSKEFGGSAAANLNTWTGKVAMVKDKMNDFVEMITGKVVPALENFAMKILDKLQPAFSAIGGAISYVVGLFKLIWDALTQNYEALAFADSKFKPFEKILLDIGAYADTFATALKMIWETFTTGDTTLDENHTYMARFATILATIYSVVRTLIDDALTILKGAWQGITMAVQGLMPSLSALWGTIKTQLVPVFKEIWDAVTRLYQALQPALMEVLKIAAIIIGVTIFAAIWILINALRILIDIFAVVERAVSDVIKWIADLIQWFGQAVMAVIHFYEGYINFILSLPGKIKSIFNEAKTWLLDAGKNIVQGLIDGITNMAGKAVQKVKDMGKDIVNGAKSILKVFSPSQEFVQIGQNVSLGMAQGIGDTAQSAIQATSQMTTNVLATGQAKPTGVNSQNTNNNSSLAYQFGPGSVVLQTAEAVDEFFSIGNRNVQLELKGGSPLAGTTGV